LGTVRAALKSRAKGYESYARVLLDWNTHEKFWYPGAEDSVPVEPLLLQALKMVGDLDLRKRIEEALIARQREVYLKKKEQEKAGKWKVKSRE
jgi:hypothetical protein